MKTTEQNTSASKNCRAKILTASAGAGKTFRLAYEYILDVIRNRKYDDASTNEEREGFDPGSFRTILAVTFTNKATGEMKSRILDQIQALASGKKSDYLKDLVRDTGLDEKEIRRRALAIRTKILHDYSRFTVLTNDTFFQRILRAFVKEIGMDMSTSIELDGDPIVDESASELIEDTAGNSELRSWIDSFCRERIEEGQSWDIKQGILSLRSELFKEQTRNAFTGITDREKFYAEIQKYTDAVRKELESIVEERDGFFAEMERNGVSKEDFKNAAPKYLLRFPNEDITEKKTLMKFADGSADIPSLLKRQDPAVVRSAEKIAPMIERMQKAYPLIGTARLLKRNLRSFALMNDLYRKTLKLCSERNTMLLSETKHIISEFIKEEDAPFIYEKVGGRFSKYMIDEFQDTSLKEWKNFLPLLREAMSRSDSLSVLLVGDIKQSIYRWRGGDWTILGRTAKEELGMRDPSAVEEQSVEDNWRSLPEVVNFNNRLFDKIVADDNGDLNSRIDGHISPSCARFLRDALKDAYSSPPQIPRKKDKGGYVSFRILSQDEEPDIAGCIDSALERGFRPCDISVLVRTKDDGDRAVDLILKGRSGSASYGIMTQEALSLDASPAVRFIIAVMKLASKRDDGISLGIFLGHTHDGDYAAELTEEEKSFLDSVAQMSPENAFEAVIGLYPFPDATAYVQTLHELIIRFSSSRMSDLTAWNEWWDTNGSKQSVSAERSENSIEIMTIHKAKGLENKVIIIPFCSWNLDPLTDTGLVHNTIWAKPAAGFRTFTRFPVPFNSSLKNSVFSEEYYRETVFAHIDAINTLYVAFTRAAEQLFVFTSYRKNSHVGDLVAKALGMSITDDVGKEYTSGDKSGPDPDDGQEGQKKEQEDKKDRKDEEKNSTVTVDRYLSTSPSVRLRLSTDRYTVDEGIRMNPRSEGILLHSAFQNAETEDDIYRGLKTLEKNGDISSQRLSELEVSIRGILSRSPMKEWFSGAWDRVYSERSIVIPGHSYRPDRVLRSGDRATVIDYKFGNRDNEYYKQVRDYMNLMKKMGCSDVQGYIWYVSMGEVDRV